MGKAVSLPYAIAPTASTLAQRDSEGNIIFNNAVSNILSTASSGGTVTMSSASAYFQLLTGTMSETYILPDATTLRDGWVFKFNNNSTGNLVIKDHGANVLYTCPGGGWVKVILDDASSANGMWDIHVLGPSSVSFSTTTLNWLFGPDPTTGISGIISTDSSSIPGATCGSLTLQAGSSLGATGTGGNIFLSPGTAVVGSDGGAVVVNGVPGGSGFLNLVAPDNGTTDASLNFLDNAQAHGWSLAYLNSDGTSDYRLEFSSFTNVALDLHSNGNAVFYKEVGIGAFAQDASAILQADSTTQGILPPRMTTTQVDAIASPAEGLQVYDSTTHSPKFYDGTNWQQVAPQVAVGTAVTSNSSALTSTTFAAFDVTPSVSFTAQNTGTYRVSAAFPYLTAGTAGHGYNIRVNGSVGSPTVVFNGELYDEVGAIGVGKTGQGYAYQIVSLTAGTSYTFQLEAKVTSGDSLLLVNAGPTNGVNMVAEQI
jgi:hypothetical protein